MKRRHRLAFAAAFLACAAVASCDDKTPAPGPSTPAAPTPNDAYWRKAVDTCRKQTEDTVPTWQQCIDNQYEVNGDR